MANRRPKGIAPFWATDVNYPAGAEAWSAQPIKVEPSDGDKAAGHVPNTRPPAEWENWFKNSVGKWLDYLADIQYSNWPIVEWLTRVTPYGATDVATYDGSNTRVDGTAKIFYANVQRAWVALGNPNAEVFTFGETYLIDLNTGSGSGVKYTHGVSTLDGRLLLTGVDDFGATPIYVDRSPPDDISHGLSVPWTKIILHSGAVTNAVVGASCTKQDGTIIFVGGVDLNLKSWASTDNGATFDHHTFLAPNAFQYLSGVREGKNGRLFAWIFDSFLNGGRDIYYSDNNGATWTTVTLTTGFDYIRDIIYVEEYDSYFVLAGPNTGFGSAAITPDPTVDGAYTWTSFGADIHAVAADTNGSTLVYVVRNNTVSPPDYTVTISNDLSVFVNVKKVVRELVGSQLTGIGIAGEAGSYQAAINGVQQVRMSLKAGG